MFYTENSACKLISIFLLLINVFHDLRHAASVLVFPREWETRGDEERGCKANDCCSTMNKRVLNF